MIDGRYKLLEEIAEGGMGTVWLAQQTEPVRRRVALKLVKPGMDSRQVLSRFEAERQALAMMDHPNIAKVLDGGVTEQGRPFFVMEYVKGVPITEYCDQAKLNLEARLALFVQVCQAVQHAHQKGIIHRDLKPSNILVCLYDGKPVPKVIDFGLAKAMYQPLTERTLYTSHGLMVGTPLYMSPEQAELNNLDIDTRSDVCALGVILYEMLTGTTPLDRQRLKDAAWQEVVCLIKEDEPSKPSTKLSDSVSLPSIAAQRSLEPAQLRRAVRGDLDWIVMKSLEKERSRRYETANGLAKDIERFLSDEPVEACPPSSVYRFRKFARRNRAALVTGLLVSAALVLGLIASTWEAIRATQAEATAENQRKVAEEQRHVAEAERAEADQQRARAEANFAKARAAVDRYFTLVSENRLLEVPGLQPLRGELMEAALHFYQGFAEQHKNDPAVLADLAVTNLRVALIYHSIDKNTDAIAAVAKALDLVDRLRREFPGASDQHRRLAGFWKGLRRTVGAYSVMPNDPQRAFGILTRLTKTWEELAAQYPEVVEFRSDLSATYFMESYLFGYLDRPANRDLAAGMLRKAQALSEALVHEHPTVPEYRADMARIDHELAIDLRPTASAKEIEALFQNSLELREELVRELPTNAQHRNDLAQSLALWGLRHGGESQKAEAAFRRSIEICRKLREDFPGVSSWGAFDVGSAYRNLSLTCARRPGGFKEAEELHREELAHWEALAIENPLDPMRCVGAQAECNRQWARMLVAVGKKEAAEDSFAAADAAYCRALDRAQKAVEENSGSPDIRHRLEIGIGPLLCFAVENRPSTAMLDSLKRVGLIDPNGDLEFNVAALLAAFGDRADYLTFCDELLSRYSTTKDPAVAERTAKACSTVEPTASNLARIANLSQRAVELVQENRSRRLRK